MCEMSDKWVREGIEIGEKRGEERGEKRGEMKKAKETALKLAKRGTAVNVIADLLDVSVGLVKQWTEGSASLTR